MLTLTAPAAEGLTGEIAARADFTRIRYAQCWEDADVLLAGLDVRPGDACLSIASAGDNTLALLTRQPGRVVAIDLSPSQLACLALRAAAYRRLQHPELLELIGSVPSTRRARLYAHCRPCLDPAARSFWDAHPDLIAGGIGAAGRFEAYFRLFRQRVLPCVHSRARVAELLRPKPFAERQRFYEETWNSRRWRMLFRIFFSRTLMGRLGRDPAFFRYVQGTVAERLLRRVRWAATVLEPAGNPYLQWILMGRHTTALPLALREEHFETIRANLDRLSWTCTSLERFLERQPAGAFDRFNLSDVFEYVSDAHYHTLLQEIARTGRPGGRLAYWNLLVPRSRPPHLADRLHPRPEVAEPLHARDRAFFYSRFIVEELC